MAASACELSVLPVLPFISVTAKEAGHELSLWPVMAKEAKYELTELPAMVTETNFELSEIPVMAIVAVNNLSS